MANLDPTGIMNPNLPGYQQHGKTKINAPVNTSLNNYMNTSDYAASLPTYQSTAAMQNNYNYQTPTAQSLNVGQWQAPKIELPDYSKFGSLPDYTGRIQQAADMAAKTGLQQLQELTFKPEYNVERERQESRGLVGSGVENENLQNLLTSQQARAGEYLANIQQQAFREQTQELQSLRDLNFQRQQTELDQAFQASIQQGNWEQAQQIHQDSIKLDLENIKQQNEQFNANYGLEIAKFNDDVGYRQWQSDIERKKAILDAYEAETGIALEEDKLDLAEEELAGKNAALAGYKGDDFLRVLNDRLGNSPIDTSTTGTNYNTPETVRNNTLGNTIDRGIGEAATFAELQKAGAQQVENSMSDDTLILPGGATWVRTAKGYRRVK